MSRLSVTANVVRTRSWASESVWLVQRRVEAVPHPANLLLLTLSQTGSFSAEALCQRHGRRLSTSVSRAAGRFHDIGTMRTGGRTSRTGSERGEGRAQQVTHAPGLHTESLATTEKPNGESFSEETLPYKPGGFTVHGRRLGGEGSIETQGRRARGA